MFRAVLATGQPGDRPRFSLVDRPPTLEGFDKMSTAILPHHFGEKEAESHHYYSKHYYSKHSLRIGAATALHALDYAKRRSCDASAG
jgi:hypothetical protein